MKKSLKIIFGLMIVFLIGFNLKYALVNGDPSGHVSLKMFKSDAVAQTEDPPLPKYYDEEAHQCSCGAWGHMCIEVQNQASCNVSGQINCEVACDGSQT